MFGIAQAQTLGAVKKDRMTIGWVRTSLSWVGTRPVDSLDKNVGKVTPWGGEKREPSDPDSRGEDSAGDAGRGGQALVEYALIISLIAVVAIATLTLTGNNVNGILNSIATAL